MTIEEKAEAYDMALETIQEILSSGSDSIMMSRLRLRLQSVFHELKESEDERIRKELIFYLGDMPEDTELRNGVTNRDVLVWLEKQGDKDKLIQELGKYKVKYTQDVLSQQLEKQAEQKPADTVEPKFHEGEWIVYKNDICQIVKREEGCNKLVTVFGIEKELVNERNLSTARLWTIQDAKDGDVLAENAGTAILMFRGIGNTKWNDVIDYYCYYDCYLEKFNVQEDVKHWGNTENNQLEPATRKQCDLLFQKMKEAGYEWDDEKKEIRKIEKQTPKREWSEEDDKVCNSIIADLKNLKLGSMPTAEDYFNKCIGWLKKLKQRMEE